MSAKDEPAFPQMANSAGYYAIQPSGGLTKRELFAGMATQGMLANPDVREDLVYCKNAVRLADDLLAELAKGAERG